MDDAGRNVKNGNPGSGEKGTACRPAMRVGRVRPRHPIPTRTFCTSQSHGTTASTDAKCAELRHGGNVFRYDANAAVRGVGIPTGPKRFVGGHADESE